MVVLPVIERELRASARHQFTYYLRTLGVAALLLACTLFGLENGFGPSLGGRLFGSLHFTLFWAIWILVPMLTADCISRERREGTLGLLFMTRLKGTDIVVAKGLAHGLRAMTLWLAVLPVVTIPFLLGGLSWSELLLSASINFSAICWALAAGLLASAWNKVWLRAMLHAAFNAICFLMGLGAAAGLVWSNALAPSGWGLGWLPGMGGVGSSDYVLLSGFGVLTDASGNWSDYLRLIRPSQLAWGIGQLTLLSVLVLVVAVLAAGAKTRRVWQEEPPSRRQIWLQQTFCTPVIWLAFFKRWMRRKLERNPIGWLEQRTWTGRLVTWSWFAVVISLYSAVLTDRNFFRGGNAIQSVMAWLLAGSMAMSAAGSFRRERESGVLELLLVSPLAENEIVAGRLRGLWGQFLPASGTLLGLWTYFQSFDPRDTVAAGPIFFYAITFLTVPVIGLYYSLRCRNFMTALLTTFTVGMLAPMVVPAVLGVVWWFFRAWLDAAPFPTPMHVHPSGGAACFQILFAALCYAWLGKRLKSRAFPLERTEV